MSDSAGEGRRELAAVQRLTKLLEIELPVIQAPMAGVTSPDMVIAVSEAGGLGSLPCAFYSPDQLEVVVQDIRASTQRPINLNFFCHSPPVDDAARQVAWRKRLEPYYRELGLDPGNRTDADGRAAFNDATCSVVEKRRPEVVSFHFGLPSPDLLLRVKKTGAKILSSATTVAEARWLGERGVDAVIAMGAEAGGHRGSFLTEDMNTQLGTIALVPQVVDAVRVPVIAAGGIADRRAVDAAFALGAAAVQVGTAYLFTPEAKLSALHRKALRSRDRGTAITNVLTGRPARGIVNKFMSDLGALSDLPPAFPTAAAALGPLRTAAEAGGRDDFSAMWAGQAFPLATPMSSADLTRALAMNYAVGVEADVDQSG